MTSAHSWVVGRGLLGSAVERAEGPGSYRARIDWTTPSRAIDTLREALKDFATGVDDEWRIYWCAGKGVTSTPADVMMAEGEVFDAFARDVRRLLGDRATGSFFLGSSVGGVYAGSGSAPFSESTPPAPLSAYGVTKLRMEESLRTHIEGTSARGFVGRITNLYGAGQDMSKGQGLLSVLVDSSVVGRPVSIYVPLDTLRDYIHVNDCGRVVAAGMQRVQREPPGTTTVKIVGSMNALSIGAIIGELSRLRRRRVPIVLGQGNATGQSLDLRVRSEVWNDLDALVSTTVPEGLGDLFRSRLAAHMRH